MDEIMLDHQEDDGRIFFEKEQANKKLPWHRWWFKIFNYS
jgi:hypothetical protein